MLNGYARSIMPTMVIGIAIGLVFGWAVTDALLQRSYTEQLKILQDELQLKEEKINHLNFTIMELSKNLTKKAEELDKLLKDFERLRKPRIAIRVDDIQDYAYKDVVERIFKFHATNNIPLTLAVIAGHVGKDNTIVEILKNATYKNFEIADHGLEHTFYSKLSYDEQLAFMTMSKNILRNLTGSEPMTFVAPNWDYNNETIKAMNVVGYKILSSGIRLQKPSTDMKDGVIHIPATVDYCYFVNGSWSARSLDELLVDVVKSVAVYGYAVILTHPQEFVDKQGIILEERWQTYLTLIEILSKSYEFTTLKDLVAI